jgi:hypothetical protein
MAAKTLYATTTNTSGIISVSYSDSHVAPVSTAIVSAINTSLDIGDSVTVVIGYVGDNFTAITGFVKNIEYKEPERFYIITISNVLVRAIDFFIASENPDTPFSRQNILAEDLIGDLLELAGLTNYSPESTSFTFAISIPVQVNLTGCYDYCKFLSDIIAFTLYADNAGVVHLINRRPYPVGSEPNDYTFDIDDEQILDASYSISDANIRNKVIVYGSAGIHKVASASSPYLPAGFFRTIVVAAPGVIDSNSMAQQSADYNLDLLNRLTQKVNLTMAGTTGIIPRKIATVSIPDIGVSGNWYVYAVEHNWSKAGYITSVELRK